MDEKRENAELEQGKGAGYLGLALAFAGALCWGFSGTCVSYLTTRTDATVLWLACTRLCICGPAFLLVALVFQRRALFETLRNVRELLRMLAIALIGVVLMQISYMSSIRLIGTGPALLIMESGLMLIMIYTCIRERRLPMLREVLCLVLTLLGVAAIGTQGQIGSLGVNGVGLLWGLGTAIALAGHNILPLPLLQKYGSVVVNGVSMTMGAILLLPFARPWETEVALTGEAWLVFGAVVVIGTFGAYCLYMQSIKYIGPMKAGLIAVMEPVSGMFFSLLLLGTPVTLWDGIGCALIVGMMVLVATQPAAPAVSDVPDALDVLDAPDALDESTAPPASAVSPSLDVPEHADGEVAPLSKG